MASNNDTEPKKAIEGILGSYALGLVRTATLGGVAALISMGWSASSVITTHGQQLEALKAAVDRVETATLKRLEFDESHSDIRFGQVINVQDEQAKYIARLQQSVEDMSKRSRPSLVNPN